MEDLVNPIRTIMLTFISIWALPAFSEGSTTTRSGASGQSMNPDVSVNILSLYQQSKRQGESKTEEGGGFSLQEVEMQFLSNVDPYLRASALISVHPEEGEPAADGEAKKEPT